MIRSTIAYGASTWYTPPIVEGNPQGTAKRLGAWQSNCLQGVAGAYKATSVRQLEIEADVPHLGLYLDRTLPDSESHIEARGMAGWICASNMAVTSWLTAQGGKFSRSTSNDKRYLAR